MADESCHLLSFKYPACKLLPPTARAPTLHEPEDVDLRNHPTLDFQLLDVFSTKFHVQLPRGNTFQRVGRLDHYDSLTAAIQNLSTLAGESTLKFVVSFDWDQQRVTHRYLLKSRVGLETFKQSFELNEEQQDRLLGLASTHPWVRVVQHLLYRESDMAYYHVMQRMLKAYPNADLELEEDDWESFWGSAEAKTPGEVLRNRLATCNPDLDFSGAAVLLKNVKFPCGHSLPLLNLANLHSMSVTDVLTSKCHCNAEILTNADKGEITTTHEMHVIRPRFLAQNRLWRDLDRSIHADSRVKFNNEMLLTALRAALDSLKPPRSILPRIMSLTHSRDAEIILRRLKEALNIRGSGNNKHNNTSQIPDATPRGLLLDFLLEHAAQHEAELRSRRPDFFSPFLRQWLKRTVNFLVFSMSLSLRRRGQIFVTENFLHHHGQRYVEVESFDGDEEKTLEALMEGIDLAGPAILRLENLYEGFGGLGVGEGS